MSNSTISCAVVGLVQGLEDVYVTLNHPRFDLKAVCDINESPYRWMTGADRIEDAATDLGQHHVRWLQHVRDNATAGTIGYVSEFAELLGRDDVDAVALVVPDALHEPFSIQALEAGKFVLCTKPMGVTIDAAHRIAEVARAHPGHYMLGFQMSYSPFTRAILDVIETGALGSVHQIRFDYHRGPWRPSHSFKNTDVDGAIVKEGTHWLDMIYRINGRHPWTKVSGFGGIDVLGDRVGFEDNGVLIVDYDGGFRAAHTFSYFRYADPIDDFLLVGERGTIRGTFDRLRVETSERRWSIDVPGFTLPHQHHVGYYDMYDEFARMCLDGAEPYSNWETGLENMLTCHAAQVAVMDGRTVERTELSGIDWRSVAAAAP